jgi:hypothetical protein
MATILSITEKIDNVNRWCGPSALRWPEIELVPEDIEVSATVDARFVAG